MAKTRGGKRPYNLQQMELRTYTYMDKQGFYNFNTPQSEHMFLWYHSLVLQDRCRSSSITCSVKWLIVPFVVLLLPLHCKSCCWRLRTSSWSLWMFFSCDKMICNEWQISLEINQKLNSSQKIWIMTKTHNSIIICFQRQIFLST